MVAIALRLRIDAPYPGESLSSFVGRAAQFYGMPVPSLLNQLMQGEKWTSGGRRDIDLNPPAALERRLAESVRDWRSPLTSHQGFHDLTLAPARRHSYCPTCFEEDLGKGRTPYFRNDWMAIFVSTCWQHGTPLFSWEATDSAGRRRLPKTWLYNLDVCKQDKAIAGAPLFFQRHREQLQQLCHSGSSEIDTDLNLTDALGYLAGLQYAVEKPSEDMLQRYPLGQDPRGLVRDLAHNVMRDAARDLRGLEEKPIASTACPREATDWFDPAPLRAAKRAWEYTSDGLRQTKTLGWRRTYLLFAARTLAGSQRFGPLISARHRALPWRTWWDRDLMPLLGPRQRETLTWMAQACGRHLDESATPRGGAWTPGLSVKRTKAEASM